MKTQNKRIVDRLLLISSHGFHMTPLDAFNMCPPITKLSTRIGEIELDGAVIEKIWHESDNIRCMSYRLVSLENYRPRGKKVIPESELYADAILDAQMARL